MQVISIPLTGFGTLSGVFKTFALHLVPGFLVIGLVTLGRPCLAQQVETPAAPGARDGSGSVIAPSGWLGLIVPVDGRIGLRIYGFYIGELNVPVAQFDVPVRTTKFLTITPSYMYYWVPASGLNKISPGGFTDSYDEHQIRVDGTVGFIVSDFELSVRAMYVRRFRPTPADDINRYRNRISVAYPLAVEGQTWKPFAAYEAYYDGGGGGWNRDRVWIGVTVPLRKRMSLQPSYLWETSEVSKDLHYLLVGLVVITR